eukprot:1158867-Pelagomonas_calceolata.AAC.32
MPGLGWGVLQHFCALPSALMFPSSERAVSNKKDGFRQATSMHKHPTHPASGLREGKEVACQSRGTLPMASARSTPSSSLDSTCSAKRSRKTLWARCSWPCDWNTHDLVDAKASGPDLLKTSWQGVQVDQSWNGTEAGGLIMN